MIRFIVERHEQDHYAGIDDKDFYTLDIDVPNLEKMLRQGGRGEGGFEKWKLIGVELLEGSGK